MAETAVTADPEALAATFALEHGQAMGHAALLRRRPEEAARWFRQVLERDPGHIDARYHLGLALLGAGHAEEAATVFAAVPPGFPPWSLPARAGECEARRQAGGQPSTIPCPVAPLPPAFLLPAVFDLVRELINGKHLDDARGILDHLLLLRGLPPVLSAEINGLLGLALARGARHEAALAHLGQAAALDPSLAWIHSHTGFVLRALGRLKEAEAACRRAIGAASNEGWPHLHLGICLQATGDVSAAIGSFETALRLDPALTAARDRLATLRPAPSPVPAPAPTPAVLDRAAEPDRSRLRRVIFHLHIPRTSGTSLRALFEANLGVKHVVDLNGTLHQFLAKSEEMTNSGHEIKLITAHVDYGVHRFLPLDGVRYSYCTMIRHPVPLLRSLYFYSLVRPHTQFHEAARRAGSLIGWFNSPDRPWDTLVYALAGYGNRNGGLAAARETLFKRIDVFGITELYSESVAALCRFYGMAEHAVSHLNASERDGDGVPDEELLEICRERDARDLALYDEARAVFLARRAKE
ncbi:MAG: tetratricopeptide repeat protein [Rhodospirillaceae bacterium]